MNAPRMETAVDDALDLGKLTGSLGFLLRMAQIRTFEQFFAAFGDQGVRPGEITTLWVIDLNPEVRQGAVAQVLHIKPAHMTKLVQRLVRDGLIERHVPQHDRRSVHLALTPAGKARLDALRPTFLNVHGAEKVGLSDREAEQLIALLNKLAFPKDRS
ncbi:MAG: MarR family winged helix-turn-helix transcriptional regulator [Pararhodobacter sp.]|nr:MarR family winged helix-turn-helix transcriptional regulator [Pararhodobacter sp.]